MYHKLNDYSIIKVYTRIRFNQSCHVCFFIFKNCYVQFVFDGFINVNLPLGKHTARMDSELILVFNCELRQFHNKILYCSPVKDNVTQRVYTLN